MQWFLWMEVIKRETAHSSLAATFPFLSGLFWSSLFFHRWRRGGSKTCKPAQHCAWQPAFTAFCGFHFSICTDPQLLGKTTSYSLMATPDSITAKAATRPPALFLLTYRFKVCRVEAFTLFPSSLSPSPSLSYHSPISCSLSFSIPLSLPLYGFSL